MIDEERLAAMRAGALAAMKELSNPLLSNLAVFAWNTEEPFLALASPLNVPARAFKENIDRIRGMLWLPIISVELAVRETTRAGTISVATLMAKAGSAENLPAKTLQELHDNVDSEASLDIYRLATNLYLTRLLEIPRYRDDVRAVLGAGTIAAWTAIECLTGDMWEAIDKSGFGKIRVTAKQMPQFKAVKGIAEAYGPLGADVAKVLDDDLLRILAATRHVLVHNAGIIDDAYMKTWETILGTPAHEYRLGQEVPLDSTVVSLLVNVAIKVGAKLIDAANEWLKANGAT